MRERFAAVHVSQEGLMEFGWLMKEVYLPLQLVTTRPNVSIGNS